VFGDTVAEVLRFFRLHVCCLCAQSLFTRN